jgi:hypothetical protein
MTTTVTDHPSSHEEARPSFGGRLWRRPLVVHAAVLAVLVVALLPLMTPSGSFTSDEGAYALQERALARGDWAYEYPAADLDPEGRYFPVNLADEGDGGFFPYVKHPAYPLLLRAGVAVFGETIGLHLLALLGVVGTAVAAWLLAAELSPRLSRPAFWLAASGPVLVNGYLLWAHTLSAALAGFALVAGVRLVKNLTGQRRRGVALTTAVAAGVLVAGVLLRSEGLLFAFALAVAVGIALIRRAGLGRAALTAAALAGPALAATLVEQRWIGAIVGGGPQNLAIRGETDSFLIGRVKGGWHELFQAGLVRAPADVAVLVAMGLLVGVGYLSLRRWTARSGRDLTVAALAAAVLYVLYLRWEPLAVITGLFAAWPLALLGTVLFVGVRRAPDETVDVDDGPPAPVGLGSPALAGPLGPRSPALAGPLGPRSPALAGPLGPLVIGLTTGLFAAAVIATQYSGGGGAEWGGRFFSPVLAPLAVLATAGLVRALGVVPRPDRRRVVAVLAVVATTTAVVGLLAVGNRRLAQDRMAQAIAGHPMPVTVTTFSGLARMAWVTDGEVTWMYTDKTGLAGLLEHLDRQGVRQVGLVTAAGDDLPVGPYGTVEEVPEPALARFGMGMYELRR